MPSSTLRILFDKPESMRFGRDRTGSTQSVEDGIPTEDRGNEWEPEPVASGMLI
jgi:hypothetical protein